MTDELLAYWRTDSQTQQTADGQWLVWPVTDPAQLLANWWNDPLSQTDVTGQYCIEPDSWTDPLTQWRMTNCIVDGQPDGQLLVVDWCIVEPIGPVDWYCYWPIIGIIIISSDIVLNDSYWYCYCYWTQLLLLVVIWPNYYCYWQLLDSNEPSQLWLTQAQWQTDLIDGLTDGRPNDSWVTDPDIVAQTQLTQLLTLWPIIEPWWMTDSWPSWTVVIVSYWPIIGQLCIDWLLLKLLLLLLVIIG